MRMIVLFIGLILINIGAAQARHSYGGGRHSASHGGHYSGGSGSSHRGGTYHGPHGGYGTHR